jgi:hypothetical protein
MGQTDRTIILNSRYRKNTSETATQFRVHLNHDLDSDKMSRIILKSVHVPHLFANCQGNRSRLYFEEGGEIHTAQIIEGHYDDPAAFLEAVKLAIDESSSSVTVTHVDKGAFTHQVTIQTSIAIKFLSHSEVDAFVGEHGDSANDMIGCPQHIGTYFQSVHTLPGVLDLSGHHFFHLVSNSLSSGHSMLSNGYTSSTMAVIPLDKPYGSLVSWESNEHLLSFIDMSNSHSTLSNIDIELRDASNQLMHLPPNVSCEIVLLIIFESD